MKFLTLNTHSWMEKEAEEKQRGENEHYVVVLHGTNEKGAIELLSGIQEFLNAKPIDLVVVYPRDGKDAKELTNKLQDEIKDNYGVLLEMLSNQEKFEAFESMI